MPPSHVLHPTARLARLLHNHRPKRSIVLATPLAHDLDPLHRSSHCGCHTGCLILSIHASQQNDQKLAKQGGRARTLTVYWAGDTVLYPAVEEAIRTAAREIIVIHPCGVFWEGDLIVMDAAQAMAVCKAFPGSVVIATHMEALDHATVSRDDLRRLSLSEDVTPDQLRIPGDGEVLEFDRR